MPTHHRGPAREVRALDAYLKLTRAANTLAAALQRELTAAGFTEGQFGALEALYHLGPLSQTDIADKLLCSGGNVCTLIDNLERRGLVKRQRSAEDRRVVHVSLTREGRRAIERAFPAHAERVTALLGALGADEQEQLAALCRKLGRAAAGR